VYRKDGIVELARELVGREYEIVSTGGTAAELHKGKVAAIEVSKATGFPEILDGRVKTLHPKIHGGILARRGMAAHDKALADHGIAPIDVVVVNLYPFEDKVAKGASFDEAMEHVDIGGPAMLRAAAKNFRDVAVVVDPADYPLLIEQLDRKDGIDAATRLYFAQKAFRHTARYEAAIAAYLAQVESRDQGYAVAETEDVFPYRLSLTFEKVQDLRYGENPHQRAAFYSDLGSTLYSVAAARKVQGKELSFNNILDLDAAWRLVTELPDPACVIVKHNNPCGAGCAETPVEAFRKALDGDTISAYGGLAAFNGPVDIATAEAIAVKENFFEGIIAPQYARGAIDILREKTKWGKNLRILEAGTSSPSGTGWIQVRTIRDGVLVQSPDDQLSVELKNVVGQPDEAQLRDLQFAWTVCKHVRSNAIVLAKDEKVVGVGAGQMSRLDSAFIAVRKAGEKAKGAVVASDAFFPFPDALETCLDAGAVAVIQPGGSIRDEEVITLARKRNIPMVLTGMRHFKH
jgi:phosphoribosylaminoimidazolecarboxamide formyltransferase/IMP cyclohydrolase